MVARKSRNPLRFLRRPVPERNRFAVFFHYDVTNKPSGQHFNMKEVALYTVDGGKITREEFFYTMG